MTELRSLWIDLVSASRTHLRVRLVAVAGAVLFLLSFVLAGGGSWWSWGGLLTLGLLLGLNPVTLLPVTFVLFAIASWWAGVEGPWHWALLPAALGLLLVHAGCALAASVPPQAAVPRSVTDLYAARVGVVAAATVLVWGLAGVISGVATGAGGAVPGIVGLTLLVAALVSYVRGRRPVPATRSGT